MRRYLFLAPLLLWKAGWCQSPTLVDLKAQSKNVDFSTAAATRPFQSGNTLPATCAVGAMFYLANAPAGSNLYGCTAGNVWTLEGGAGAGALNASQLTDLAASLSGPTTLAIGTSCSAVTPCNVRYGSLVRSFTAPTSASISAGSGMAFIYLDSAGSLTVGHNMTVSCASGCVAAAGVSAFPASSLPLFTWTATNGTWDTTGGTDLRAFQSVTNIAAGSGLLSTTASGLTTLTADPSVIGLLVPTPATSSSACTKGSWSMDASYYYLCVAANSWRRVALTSW